LTRGPPVSVMTARLGAVFAMRPIESGLLLIGGDDQSAYVAPRAGAASPSHTGAHDPDVQVIEFGEH